MAVEDTINDLIDAVEAIERELGILPSSVYANVRARLDILEARINNPFAPSPTVENPFIIGNDGTTISTGEGVPSGTQPPGSLYLRTDGYDANAVYYFRPDGYWAPVATGSGGGGGGSPIGPAGGDLSGTYPNPEVSDLTITSEEQGSILYFDGSNWVQLSPGTDGYVLTTHSTGADPTWALASIGSAGGDLTGTYPNPTIGTNKVTNSQFRKSGALSLVGNASNATADVADIQATASSGAVLRESGGTLSFGTIATAGIANNAIDNTKIRDSSALSVIGRSANSSGDPADIAGTNNQVLRVSGSVLGFGAVDLSTMVTGTLASGNQASQSMSGDVGGTTASATVNKIKGTALGTSVGTVGATQDGYALVWVNGSNEWRPQNVTGTGGPPSGSAGGDLGSTYPNPTVTDLTIASEQQGSVLYYNGSNWVQLSPGTNGNVLTTHGTGANPSWTAVSGGGGGGSTTPLSNVYYVDGGTTVTDGYRDGSIAAPFKTIEEAYAANPTYTILVTPGNYAQNTGSSATITALSGTTMTIGGLTDMTANVVGKTLALTGSASNDGVYQIINFNSSSSVDVYTQSGTFPDANSGSIGWSCIKILETNGINLFALKPPPGNAIFNHILGANFSLGYIINRGNLLASGTGAAFSDQGGGLVYITGLSGVTGLSGKIFITGADFQPNNGFFDISSVVSDSIVAIQNNCFVTGDAGSITWEIRDLANDINISGAAMSLFADSGIDAGGAIVRLTQTTVNQTGVPSQSGSAASITTFTSGKITLTGLTGMIPEAVGRTIQISGSADPNNDGIFFIVKHNSDTSVDIYNPLGSGSDSNNGSIVWSEYTKSFENITYLVGNNLQIFGGAYQLGLTYLTECDVEPSYLYLTSLAGNSPFISSEKTYISGGTAITFYPTVSGTLGDFVLDDGLAFNYRGSVPNITNGYLDTFTGSTVGKSVNLGGLSDAASGSGTLFTPPFIYPGGNNVFRIAVYIAVTSPGVSGDLTLTFDYTDDVGATSQSTTPLSVTTPGRNAQEFIIHVSSDSGPKTITYTMGAITDPTGLAYNLRIEADRLSI